MNLLTIAVVQNLQHIPRFWIKEFSAAVQKNPPATGAAQPGGPGKPTEKSGSSKAVFFGSLAVGGGVALAYGTGYLDPFLGRKKQPEPETVILNEDKKVEEYVPRVEEESSKVNFAPEHSEEKIDAHSDVTKFEGLGESEGESQSQAEDKSVVSDITAEKDLGEFSQNANVGVSSEENVDDKSREEKTSEVPKEEVQTAPLFSETDQQESEIKALAPQQEIIEDKAEVVFIWVPFKF